MSTVCVCVCLQNLSSEIKCWTKNFSVVFFASCFLSSSRNVFWLPFEDSVQHEQQREREGERRFGKVFLSQFDAAQWERDLGQCLGPAEEKHVAHLERVCAPSAAAALRNAANYE